MNHVQVAEEVLNQQIEEGRLSLSLPKVNLGFAMGGYLLDYGKKAGEQWRIFQPDGKGWVRADLYEQPSCKAFRFNTEREAWESLVRAYLGVKELKHRIESWKAAYVPTPTVAQPLAKVLAQVIDCQLHLFWHRRVELPELAHFGRPSGDWAADRSTILEVLQHMPYIEACYAVDRVLKWMPMHGTPVSRKLAPEARRLIASSKKPAAPRRETQGKLYSLFG